MEDIIGILVGGLAIVTLFIGLPWLILHYVTKWKQAPKITVEDENLLDEMFVLARRLEDRLQTVERIAAADHPDWKPGLNPPAADWQPGVTAPSPTFSLDRRN
ncbi:envelope stress response membrane protein PspB [Sphingomonas sp.]|uniref:envelope stress response membrane protein PspB n=1 Tax=Sphingomonas sp. TaxID=28214 RepID=UPI003B00EE60